MNEATFSHPTSLWPLIWPFHFKMTEHEPRRHQRREFLPEVGRSVLQNSSLHAESIKMLLNLLSKEATYFARGWEPEQEHRAECYPQFCVKHMLHGGRRGGGVSVYTNHGWLTYRDQQEAYVTQPVRRLIGQLLHKEPQDGAEVALITCYRHLHCWGSLCVAVTAAGWNI